MKKFFMEVGQQSFGCLLLIAFMTFTGSIDKITAPMAKVRKRAVSVALQDTTTPSKGEVLITKVVPAARVEENKLLDIADAKVKQLRAHDRMETQRADAAEKMVNDLLQSMKRPAVTFSNDYDSGQPCDCPTDTVKVDHYYKKTLFGKLKPIAGPVKP